MRRLLFIAPTAANGLVTLLVIPVVLHTAGVTAWASIALGQSVGGVGMTVVAFGWAISGPAMIGATDRSEHGALFTRVVLARALLTIPVFLACAIVSMALPGGMNALAVTSAVATAAIGLNSVWYFVGTGEPLRLLVLDTAPRTLAVLIGMGALMAGASPIVLMALQILGVTTGVGLSWYSVAGRRIAALVRAESVRDLVGALRAQTDGVGFGLLNSFVVYLPLPLVAVFAPQAAAGFAVVDKVQKQLVTAAVPLGNMVVAAMADRMRRVQGTVLLNARRSAVESAAVGVACAAGTALVASFLGSWLSLGTLTMSPLLVLALALTVSSAFLSRTLPPAVLAPLGRVRLAMVSGVAGLVALVPLVTAGSRLSGVTGAEAGLGAAMLLMCVVQAAGLVRPVAVPVRTAAVSA